MQRTRAWGPIVAALLTTVALFVLAAPAAGAVGSVSTASGVAEEPTTHRFVLDAASGGNLSAVDVRYRSDAGLGDASLAVGVDRDGDGRIDERVATARTRSGDRGIEADIVDRPTVQQRDAIVVEVRDVRNPSAVGTHTAAVGATLDDTEAETAVTYRVAPFRNDATEFRDVAVPGSSFQRTYAADSRLADVRLADATWRGVEVEASTVRSVRSEDDTWTDVRLADTTASDLRTERTGFEGVVLADSTVTGVDAADDTWQNVAVTNATIQAVDSEESTYSGVRLAGARVDGLAASDSSLEAVVVRPAADSADSRNVSDGELNATDGSIDAAVTLDGPALDDDPLDDATAGVTGGSAAPNRTVANVSLDGATLRNVTVADGALVDVRIESATLRNVTLENVTLRGVTLSDATYADGTLTDEVITSEAEFRQELLVDDAAGRLNDGDLDVSATVDPASGNATADDGGAVDAATDGRSG
jgi:uncharacterized protein YjbI with pentapeptide repeats